MYSKAKILNTAAFGALLLITPVAACASEPADQQTRAIEGDLEHAPLNTHARTFEYAYEMAPVSMDGVTIIAKHLEDGSRWGLLGESWYDLDRTPGIARKIAMQELSPPNSGIVEKKPDNMKVRRQFEINLEYYQKSVALRGA